MTRLLITAGDGPVECRLFVAHLIRLVSADAEVAGLACAAAVTGDPPASAIISLFGDDQAVTALAQRWTGAMKWVCDSPTRPNHKRRNWFVSIAPAPPSPQSVNLHVNEVRFQTCRAGGPGGQHQNTTDSAVRATHTPTGFSVVARDQRSQHRNKAAALNRLAQALADQASLTAQRRLAATHRARKQVTRGQPSRIFHGPKLKER